MGTREVIEKLRSNIEAVYHGKSQTIELALTALLARGHLLLEDVPGVGKTTLASVLAQSIKCEFQRIQFTSDMLPSDILGVTIYNQDSHEFEFKPGPLFANVVLADEINRTTPKSQSALLEAMNSARVSIDRVSHDLPQPFMVLATQNPLEFHGTFPLPKSQMDRFVMRLHLGYPTREDEVRVLREQRLAQKEVEVEAVVTPEDVVALQEQVGDIKINDDLLDYIVRIGQATRTSAQFELGCSTRGLLALRRSAQAYAYVQNRDYVVPDDIKEVAVPCLAHRCQVARTFESSLAGHHEDEDAIRQLMETVEVPL